MEHIHLPLDVKILFYVAIASGLVLLFYFYFWVAIAGAISLAFWKFLTHRVSLVDNKIVARLFRQRDDKLQGYVLPIREGVSPKNYDIIASIESQALKGVGVFGTAGSGKSTYLAWLSWIYSRPEETARYGLDTVNVFAFNFHRFQKGKGDFEGLGFEYVNIAKYPADLFNPLYKEFLIRAFSVVFVSILTNIGIMASMLSPIFREVLDVKPYPKSWNDFRKNAEIVKGKSEGIKRSVLEIILTRLSALEVGEARQVEFDFNKSLILDFAFLPTEESKSMMAEFYANVIYDKAENESIAGKPHSVMLTIDEAHRLLKYSRDSIIADILVNGRKHLRTAIASQNTTDVHESLFHFQWFQFKTSNAKDIEHIKRVDELHGEAVKKLNEKEFVWVNDGHSQSIPIFKLDIVRLEEFRETYPQIYPNEKVESTKEEIEDTKEETLTTEGIQRFDKAKVELAVLDVIKNSETGLFISEVLTKIGYGDRNHRHRGDAFRLIKKMGKDGKIRIKDYISADKRKHKLVFNSVDANRAESQVHREQRIDVVELLKKEKISYKEGLVNQGWDFYTENAVLECESGLKNSLKEWNDKVMTSEKIVITILCDEQDRERYSYLSCVESGKTKLVLLSELSQVLRSLDK